MTPQGGPHSSNSTNSMSTYPPNHQSPMSGPNPASRNWNQPQGGFGGPGIASPGYGSVQMPGSASSYGRGEHNPSGGWAPQSTSGFPSNGPNSNYGGYQG